MADLNYSQALKKVEQLIYQWNQRYLTPLGKITIIKTLVLSKLNHLFLSLPHPNKESMKQIESMMYKFIWNGKPDRIKRTTLTQNFLNGGMNMIDLTAFISSLKVTWVRRIYSNPKAPWTSLAKTYIGTVKKLALLGPSYPTMIAKRIKNQFWIEVLDCWSTFLSKLQAQNSSNLLMSPIWYNPKISNSDMFFPHWYHKGIVSVADIILDNGSFMSLNEIRNSFDIQTNFLEYHRVLTGVKTYCKKMRIECPKHVKPVFPIQVKILTKSNKGTKDFYALLREREVISTRYSYWEQLFSIKISKQIWKQIFKNCFKTVQDNTLIWMQYRILNRILGTCEYLFKINVKENPKCSFCDKESETIIHLFFCCEHTQIFWTDLKSDILLLLDINLSVKDSDVILGDTTGGS